LDRTAHLLQELTGGERGEVQEIVTSHVGSAPNHDGGAGAPKGVDTPVEGHRTEGVQPERQDVTVLAEDPHGEPTVAEASEVPLGVVQPAQEGRRLPDGDGSKAVGAPGVPPLAERSGGANDAPVSSASLESPGVTTLGSLHRSRPGPSKGNGEGFVSDDEFDAPGGPLAVHAAITEEDADDIGEIRGGAAVPHGVEDLATVTATGTRCGRCGDCCERITISNGQPEVTAESVLDRLAAGTQGWWEEENDRRADDVFILTYWDLIPGTEEGEPWFTCQWWDPVTRTCGTHDNLPRVCSEYPWYERNVVDPGEDLPWSHVSKRCSFLADVINRMAVGG
jgi:Fe-S-cluster containining protein